MRSYSFLNQATVVHSPLSFLLSAAPQSQASNWKQIWMRQSRTGIWMNWGRKGRRSWRRSWQDWTGPGTRPCSKRQANSTKLLLIYKEKLWKKPQTNQPTSDKPQHILKLLQQYLCVPGCWHYLIEVTLQELNNCSLRNHYPAKQKTQNTD